MKRLLLATTALIALGACKKKERQEDRVEPERPTPVPRATTPVPLHDLLAYAKGKAPGQTPWRISIDYVRSDGLIDPAFGVVEVWFGASAREPVDDPNRPTGAPVSATPAPPPAKCARLIWRNGVWSEYSANCVGKKQLFELRCTVPIIWERAIAKGAPRDAVAKLSLSRQGDQVQWRFGIEDRARDVSFNDTFVDDCGLVAEAPDPTVGPDSVSDGLDRKMIQNSIGTVKADVRACANQDDTKGQVKISVKVSPEGTPTVTVKEQASEVLGACVKKAVERARFPPTRNGGSFAYPFVF